MLFRVLQQLATEFFGEQNGADLPFESDFSFALLNSSYGDTRYFADPDTGGSNSFHQKFQPFPPQFVSRVQKTLVVILCQLTVGIPKQATLDFEKFHPTFLQAEKLQQAVQGGKHGVDSSRCIILRCKMRLTICRQLFSDFSPVKPGSKCTDAPQIFLHGCTAFFLYLKDNGRMLRFVVVSICDSS